MRISTPAKHILFCFKIIWHDVILIISDSASLRQTYSICNNNQHLYAPCGCAPPPNLRWGRRLVGELVLGRLGHKGRGLLVLGGREFVPGLVILCLGSDQIQYGNHIIISDLQIVVGAIAEIG